MSSIITFGQFKSQRVAERLGLSPCGEDFLSVVNRALEELMDAGRWFGTYRQLAICPEDNCLVWPPSVRSVESIMTCHEVMPVRNAWFEFQQYVLPPAVGVRDDGTGGFQRNYDGVDQLLDRGRVPTYRKPKAPGVVRLYAAAASDYGKRVLVQGLDQNGQEIRTHDVTTDVWVYGEYLTLASPFTTSVNIFKTISGVQKPVTDNLVRLYGIQTGSTTEDLLSEYGALETNPAYRKTYCTLPLCPPATVEVNRETSGCERIPCARPIYRSIVRLNFVPVKDDADVMMIGSARAVETACQALLLQQKQDWNGYGAMWQTAVKQLRSWHESYAGQREKTVITAAPHGGAPFEYVVGGFI